MECEEGVERSREASRRAPVRGVRRCSGNKSQVSAGRLHVVREEQQNPTSRKHIRYRAFATRRATRLGAMLANGQLVFLQLASLLVDTCSQGTPYNILHCTHAYHPAAGAAGVSSACGKGSGRVSKDESSEREGLKTRTYSPVGGSLSGPVDGTYLRTNQK